MFRMQRSRSAWHYPLNAGALTVMILTLLSCSNPRGVERADSQPVAQATAGGGGNELEAATRVCVKKHLSDNPSAPATEKTYRFFMLCVKREAQLTDAQFEEFQHLMVEGLKKRKRQ